MQKAEQQTAEQRQHDIDLYGSAYVRKRESGSGFGSFLEDYGLGIAIVVFLVFFLMPIWVTQIIKIRQKHNVFAFFMSVIAV
ncbi:hypothetical protein KOL64_21190 (plasmid) [Providencia rettgeri]|uniref:Uncharacterized protein n=1 Tax=Providencia rettgeri TaxID=587 RepID=A0AAJ6JXN6_PRORE|nr:hypothetical protein [Providencia rettgeri]WHT81727.1 hypothetical protein KOL65_20205 [Providencia rettgeri]WHT95939.1 hypothetical protein KOF27_20760 [Providencia rettgeri]WJM88304.1 hypothetical protein KOL64_21190 [Providencia rettgeri]